MNTSSPMTRTLSLAAVFAAALASGCASRSDLQLTAARGAIEEASLTAGPTSLGGLALSREKMTLAVRLNQANDHEPARWLAEQAQVDAELARATDLAARAVQDAARWQESARVQQGLTQVGATR